MFCHSSWRIFAPRIIHGLKRLIIPLAMAFPTILLLNVVPLSAQVEWKDGYVTLAPQQQSNPAVAEPAQSTFTIVVWEDTRNGNKDIYAQKIDNATRVSLWEPDGIPICTAPNDQRNPRAAYDSVGGVFIVWEDCRADVTNNVADLYAIRLDVSTGQISSAGWQLDGNLVCANAADRSRPRIVGSGDGVFIAWNEIGYMSGTVTRDVKVTYVLFNASIAPGSWAPDGVKVAPLSSSDQINAEIDRDYIWLWDQNRQSYRCGVVVAYQDDRNSSTSSQNPCWNIYLDQFNSTGTGGYGEVRAADPSAYNQDTEEQINHVLRTSGNEATAPRALAIVAWQDQRDGAQSGSYYIYAQVLDDLGIPLNNYTGGLPVCTVPGSSRRNPVMTIWERRYFPLMPQPYTPFAIIAWEDDRNGGNWDVYACLLDANESVPSNPNFPWLAEPAQPSGDPISTEPYAKAQLVIDCIGGTVDATAYCGWRQSSSNTDIWYEGIDLLSIAGIYIPTWTPQHPLTGWAVTLAKGEQNDPKVSGDMFVFQDERRQAIANDSRSDTNIYCQRPGECVGPTNMDYRDMYVRWWNRSSSQYDDAKHMRYTVDPSDHSMYVVWDQQADGEQSIFIQKLDKDGVPRWTNNGVKVSANAVGTPAELPAVAIDNAGGAWVVWQEGITGTRLVFMSQVLADGSTSTPAQVLCPGTHTDFREPLILYNYNAFTGPVIVAFLGTKTANGNDDRLIWSTPITPASPLPNYVITSHTDLRLETDDNGECYLMTRSSGGIINVTHANFVGGIVGWTALIADQNERSTYIPGTFGGYDLCADVLPPPVNGGSMHHLMIAYSSDNGTGIQNDIYIQRYDPNVPPMGMATTPPAIATLSVAGPNDYHTMPAVEPDSIDWSGLGWGGFHLAWDWAYSPFPGVVRHRAVASGIGWGISGVPLFHNGIRWFSVSSESPAATHPDIARQTNQAPYLPGRAFVVWEGGGELAFCNPPRPKEIMAHYVEPTNNNQWVWSSEQMVSPGGGNYSQSGPLVETSVDNSVSTFWYDSRAGLSSMGLGILGTRFNDISGTAPIGWFKSSPIVHRSSLPAADQLDMSVHPDPVSRGSGGPVILSLTASEAGFAEVNVADILGRIVSVPYHGTIEKGTRQISFSMPSTCQCGTYFVTLKMNGMLQVRSFRVIW
jgi:hypothetical protein